MHWMDEVIRDLTKMVANMALADDKRALVGEAKDHLSFQWPQSK